ncbi:hypothetical protein [Noviluteimonas gilva]|uniref:hypothetical protein n=1 Tax=Noviluteimonas gilva TaxID=2682097 RepID=UPI0018D20C3D|nr:hypothetical protein [Lysobacter gilvus]
MTKENSHALHEIGDRGAERKLADAPVWRYSQGVKYVTVVIAKDPLTGQLTIDKAATQARVAAVRKAATTRAPSGLGTSRKVAKKAATKAAKKVTKKTAKKAAARKA